MSAPRIACAALIALAAAGCTKAESAKRVLEQQGYTNVQVGGWAAFECGREDTYATSFTATAPNGETVNGAVCEGVFKGKTVRLN